jgi:hypothetical protein
MFTRAGHLTYVKPNLIHNAGQNLDMKIGNRWFENVAQFRYLGTTIRNENLIQKEIKEEIELR